MSAANLSGVAVQDGDSLSSILKYIQHGLACGIIVRQGSWFAFGAAGMRVHGWKTLCRAIESDAPALATLQALVDGEDVHDDPIRQMARDYDALATEARIRFPELRGMSDHDTIWSAFSIAVKASDKFVARGSTYTGYATGHRVQ